MSLTSSVMLELFAAKEMAADSPKVAWLKENGLTVRYIPPRQGQYRIGRFRGATEEEVIAKFARRRKLKTWHDEPMALKQYKFTVENAAGAKTSFRGDGHSVDDAFKDGFKNLQRGDAIGLSVESKGEIVEMVLPQFEAASPVKPETEEPDFE